jgi:hypothetical protein
MRRSRPIIRNQPDRMPAGEPLAVRASPFERDAFMGSLCAQVGAHERYR